MIKVTLIMINLLHDQSYFEVLECPKCKFAFFDLDDSQRVWQAEKNIMVEVTLPGGVRRKDLDTLDIICPICNIHIQVTLEIVLRCSVSADL